MQSVITNEHEFRGIVGGISSLNICIHRLSGRAGEGYALYYTIHIMYIVNTDIE